MRFSGIIAACALACLVALQPVAAAAENLTIRVSLASQTMSVSRNGTFLYSWPVSTARAGKVTPVGRFKPQTLSKYHRSSLYNNAPMPHSIFFRGNYAIHGTTEERRLGRPASAGCVRLARANAAVLFDMVRSVGKQNTVILIDRG